MIVGQFSEKVKMLIKHDREKLLNAIIFLVNQTKNCGKTKLFKLLYYLDFMHFRETGRSVTGMDYFAWDFGPVPQDLFFELTHPSSSSYIKEYIKVIGNEKDFTKLIPLKKFDEMYFTKRELKLLEQIAFIFKDATTDQIVEAVHLPNHPWDRTIKEKGEKKKIDYLLAIDSSKGSLSMEEVEERIKGREEIEKAFNE